MIKRILKKIKKLFSKEKKPLLIHLPVRYNVYTNASIFDVPETIMNDIKNLATKKILENPKLLERANKEKFLLVKFGKSVPIGINVDVTHTFYWNGESLFSTLHDSQSMIRDTKIDSILNS